MDGDGRLYLHFTCLSTFGALHMVKMEGAIYSAIILVSGWPQALLLSSLAATKLNYL